MTDCKLLSSLVMIPLAYIYSRLLFETSISVSIHNTQGTSSDLSSGAKFLLFWAAREMF